jgi:hypothetical protein
VRVHVRDDMCLHGFTSLHTLRCVSDEERTGVYQHIIGSWMCQHMIGSWMCQHTLYGTLRYRLPSHRVTGVTTTRYGYRYISGSYIRIYTEVPSPNKMCSNVIVFVRTKNVEVHNYINMPMLCIYVHTRTYAKQQPSSNNDYSTRRVRTYLRIEGIDVRHQLPR